MYLGTSKCMKSQEQKSSLHKGLFAGDVANVGKATADQTRQAMSLLHTIDTLSCITIKPSFYLFLSSDLSVCRFTWPLRLSALMDSWLSICCFLYICLSYGSLHRWTYNMIVSFSLKKSYFLDCLSPSSPVCLCVCHPLRHAVYKSVCYPLWPYLCMSFRVSVTLCARLSVCIPVHTTYTCILVCLSPTTSVCLFVCHLVCEI